MIVKIRSRSEWINKAKCVGMDPNIFHPTRGESTIPACKICYLCDARIECLEYAIANGIKTGIYGGCSERSRRRIRKARLLARQQQKNVEKEESGIV